MTMNGATPRMHIRYRSPCRSRPKSTAGPSVEAFLWGLLPDNEHVLARWATKFQVSARNVFALISHVGEDCAGAVQFVTPERLERHTQRQGG